MTLGSRCHSNYSSESSEDICYGGYGPPLRLPRPYSWNCFRSRFCIHPRVATREELERCHVQQTGAGKSKWPEVKYHHSGRGSYRQGGGPHHSCRSQECHRRKIENGHKSNNPGTHPARWCSVCF